VRVCACARMRARVSGQAPHACGMLCLHAHACVLACPAYAEAACCAHGCLSHAHAHAHVHGQAPLRARPTSQRLSVRVGAGAGARERSKGAATLHGTRCRSKANSRTHDIHGRRASVPAHLLQLAVARAPVEVAGAGRLPQHAVQRPAAQQQRPRAAEAGVFGARGAWRQARLWFAAHKVAGACAVMSAWWLVRDVVCTESL